jgi:signal peptidase I
MIDGVLQINGEPVEMEKLNEGEDEDGDFTRYRETLPNGVEHIILDRGARSLDNTDVYEVPAGHFFMMGDNRDNSTDSRVLDAVGYVPFENLVGRAEVIFFSVQQGSAAWEFWKWPWTVRTDRIFQLL